MELKPGYKQTKVGIIPQEWDEALLGTVAERGSGHTPDKQHPEYWGGDIKWVSLADSDALDDLYIDETTAKITPLGIANSSAVLHPAETVILSRDAGVGKSAILRTEMAVSQHFMAWRCGSRLDNRFLYYWLQTEKPQFERIASGNTIKTIGLPYFKNLQIPLPPFLEQRAIAAALSDVDALIAALDQLIAKKRDLKQAAMQQLLTGQTRLPGFHGEWEVNQFADVANPRRARVDPQVSQPHEFCIELEHIESGSGALLGSTTTNEYSSLKSVFRKGDVLFGKLRAYLRKFWLATRSGVCSTEIWVLVPNGLLITSGYLFQIVKTDQFIEAASNSYGTHMPRSDWSVVKSLEIRLPPLPEQASIVEVLSDMDTELEALERRREKTIALKQGMMQELLTGRVRLV